MLKTQLDPETRKSQLSTHLSSGNVTLAGQCVGPGNQTSTTQCDSGLSSLAHSSYMSQDPSFSVADHILWSEVRCTPKNKQPLIKYVWDGDDFNNPQLSGPQWVRLHCCLSFGLSFSYSSSTVNDQEPAHATPALPLLITWWAPAFVSSFLEVLGKKRSKVFLCFMQECHTTHD